ncbi:type III PLP-dependent enzyme [Geminicoccus roseus]|uniref:type III PLP-dependent enzyme n=1 Tax=Geminicoccus roseus TaxID=404900 RepID=UPI000412376D|nr:type III PLP-dependent enzyme [Geminicoccus roseus]
MNQKLARAARELDYATPCLLIDVDRVEANFRALRHAMPDTAIYYAMKANPAPEIMDRVASLGGSFDCASVNEIEMALATGAEPTRISFGNTIKKERDIARAFELGVPLYAFDSLAELQKIARAAPGSRVFCRILTDGVGAEWPLSRKFGCVPAMAVDLLREAARLGVVPWGISFHVGSQQKNVDSWDSAVAEAAAIFTTLEADGIKLGLVNLGGGFPTAYLEDVPAAEAYGEAIHASLMRHFGNRMPQTIIEPGRGLVGDCGLLVSEVVLVAEKGDQDGRPWVYLDVGKFGGLAETMDEAIRYRITTDRKGPEQHVVIAGPTCDSADVLYEKSDYRLPADLAAGDRVQIHGTGAYTTTYASVAFNGFAPLACRCI